jgi:hypothetical protein|tara:strand:- start:1693 stop:1806 length:114 start_codon:yes stop_codon:yes gene_type:complete
MNWMGGMVNFELKNMLPTAAQRCGDWLESGAPVNPIL